MLKLIKDLQENLPVAKARLRTTLILKALDPADDLNIDLKSQEIINTKLTPINRIIEEIITTEKTFNKQLVSLDNYLQKLKRIN
ncbi:MAG: hypothetical protein HWD61_07560 [Parachlamydiaceae bacterium]|nr:MAG: hypothetical protein HWD61_07560 [Parachlamydiaceae bacterium]